jgi:hypothetical protein
MERFNSVALEPMKNEQLIGLQQLLQFCGERSLAHLNSWGWKS